MALSSTDLSNIKTSVNELLEPWFSEVNRRFDQTDRQLGQFRVEFDSFTAATDRKFHTVFTDVAIAKEELHVVKQLVREHGFRLAMLENRKTEGEA